MLKQLCNWAKVYTYVMLFIMRSAQTFKVKRYPAPGNAHCFTGNTQYAILHFRVYALLTHDGTKKYSSAYIELAFDVNAVVSF